MSLLEVLKTWPLDHPGSLGRYDDDLGLRVDEDGRPLVDLGSAHSLSTQTRGGADRDHAPVSSLGTVTKTAGTDSDDVPRLLFTKTGKGRDEDQESTRAVFASARTLVGPDRD